MTLSAVLQASPLLVCLAYLALSRAQRHQVGATVPAWLATCAAFALIACLPLGSWGVLGALGREPGVAWLAQALVFSTLLCARMLGPLRGQAQLGGFASAEPTVEERVRAVARRLGVKAPSVRSVRTLGNLRAFAAVVSPMRPTLLVSDGILQRLSASEVDAILAHELAHLKNRTLWHIPLVFSGSTSLALLLMGVAADENSVFQPLIIVAAFLGVMLPLYSVYSRPNERWCDLRAARAVGFRTTADALDKIHTALPLPDRGWRAWLAYAVTTHPPRLARLAHLRGRAAEDERRQMPGVNRRELFRGWVLAWLAFAGWLTLLGWGLVLFHAGDANSASLLLLLPALIQMGCVGVALWPTLRRAGRLVPIRRRGRWWIWGGPLLVLATVLGAVPLFSLLRQLAGRDRALRAQLLGVGRWSLSFLAIAGAVAMLWGCVLIARQRRLMARATALLSDLDAEGLGSLARKRGRRDPTLRYYAALGAVAAGDREHGLRTLEELAREPVRVPAALLTLSTLLRASAPARSLALAEQLVARLPSEPLGQLGLAFALRANGRLHDAEDAARKAQTGPGQTSAVALALRARLALDRGELARAADLLSAAHRAAPREPYALVVQAHLARLSGTAEEASLAEAEARAAVKQNPLLFLDDELKSLEHPKASTVLSG
jgi:Zn-dependent protease with chaperone function